MEIHVPAHCLDRSFFVKHQGVSPGIYTVGLGLKYMSYCTDREDVCSLALTAASSLLRKSNIEPRSIGHLKVGTELPIDKAKSVKSVLTTLFAHPGNKSMEGIDTIRACYGGTKTPCSTPPTGSNLARGTVKMPSSPPRALPSTISMLRARRRCWRLPCGYTSTLDECHKNLLQRLETARNKSVLDLFSYMAFHSPNCKLVSKSYGRLQYNDCLASYPNNDNDAARCGSKELEKVLVALTRDRFRERVEPCIAATSRCGNMYTSSLYCSLRTLFLFLPISLISNIDLAAARGKTIGLFSYGSGTLARRLACALRAKAYGANIFKPAGDTASLLPGTFYLETIDDEYRRTYVIKQ
ncbi:hypothetical protein N657DRAFT_661650 [Parathielavia appendiculata]|uniref:Hydroxymethylglutaryl-CoA synthase n=1 Tax=Parathielavia appendiculata TaxID=2587402 RepID=A0AAN6U9N6_9PEZI|nr:hypothetical protein N657DRAFT_661650 [Parathielavia appendiculata]